MTTGHLKKNMKKVMLPARRITFFLL